ncbi:tRNA 4-thiouridine(8) synthase ThiI [Mycoplasma tauri]|uniref:tRNA uracil 4-sulfurtransferase ThiI n=1 Tax=Mycoplasma tauri TaxID=547987 RepID=UPI001967D570|nr:tRNA uracil 4-sulfurtransferase ThiI [Mycoplasma tauri]QSB07682.1 tRNA 4-thiouridine(8) synthase ThiI [Mycoplasma tauri]
MYSKILIRYGELTLKGKNREQFTKQLARNVKNITGEIPIVEFDRMYLSYSEENIKSLNYVFGITSFSPVIECENDIDKISQLAYEIVDKCAKTFKVSARRNNKGFKYKSSEINNNVGSFILKNIPSITVDVHNPEVNVNIEVRKNSTYIFTQNYKALGGLPVGVSGEVLHLMSGGLDSPIAAFQLMKRGLKVKFLSFVSPPQTDEKTIEKMHKIIQILSKYQGKTEFYLANYSELMNYISFTSDESYRINLMRRSFYRIASEVAKKINILALSNGENLGQVASQTLESLSTIANATNLLIFRPLLTNDKIETIEIAKKIGTYDLCIEKTKETCELFAPQWPVTKPRLEKSIELEKELNKLPELEKELIENRIKKIIV